jgi:large subunit ribosomal protein L18
LRHIHAQVIDDHKGLTLVSVSTLDKEVGKGSSGTGNKAAAKLAGGVLAKRAASAGVLQVVFDRGRARYHGRIKDFADGARAGGLKF